jgi:hypothetical protein
MICLGIGPAVTRVRSLSGDPFWPQVVLLVQGPTSPNDSSLLANNPAIVTAVSSSNAGMVTAARGPSTPQLQYNGVSLFNQANPTFTLEFFVQPSDPSASFFMAIGPTNYFDRSSVETIRVVNYGGMTFNGIPAPTGAEVHLAIVRDVAANAARFYVNGVLNQQQTLSPFIGPGSSFDFFATPTRGDLLQMVGRIRQVRLTAAARYSGPTCPVPSGLYPTSL